MMSFARRFSILTALCIALGACSPPRATSRVQITVPKGFSIQKIEAMEALPSEFVYCFGVNVTASDLGTPADGTCQPPLAASYYKGFVGEDGTLSLEIPRGSNRRFELFMYLADSGASCPTWDSTFNSSKKFGRTYSVAVVDGVSLTSDTADVTMKVEFPGLQNAVAKQLGLSCTDAGKLNGVLYSNGDLRNASGAPFVSASDPSSPVFDSFFKILEGQSDILGLGRLWSTGDLSLASTTVAMPKWVRSVTRKPDFLGLYGLVGDGTIVALDISTGAATSLTTATCPFADTSCTVPPWFQSISAGKGTDLYGLDHSGQIYKVKAGGVLELVSTTVSPAVSQVSFF